MAEHVLKTRPVYWDAVSRGEKPFEVRVNDRAYQTGDVLVLIRGDTINECTDIDCTLCRPKWLTRRVTYVFGGDPTLRDCGGVVAGHVVLGLAVDDD